MPTPACFGQNGRPESAAQNIPMSYRQTSRAPSATDPMPTVDRACQRMRSNWSAVGIAARFNA